MYRLRRGEKSDLCERFSTRDDNGGDLCASRSIGTCALCKHTLLRLYAIVNIIIIIIVIFFSVSFSRLPCNMYRSRKTGYEHAEAASTTAK